MTPDLNELRAVEVLDAPLCPLCGRLEGDAPHMAVRHPTALGMIREVVKQLEHERYAREWWKAGC